MRFIRTPVRTKCVILTVISVVVFSLAVFFSLFNYLMISRGLMRGIDGKLLTAANMARAVLPRDYHEKITNAVSVTSVEYKAITDEYNKLCKAVEIEYLWSLIMLDGKVMLTSAGSRNEAVKKAGGTGFFEEMPTSGLFIPAFKKSTPTFLTYHENWGSVRIVLVPFHNSKGDTYLFGGGIRLYETENQLRKVAVVYAASSLLVLVLVLVIASIIVDNFEKPMTRYISIMKKMADGHSGQEIPEVGTREQIDLAVNFNALKYRLNDILYLSFHDSLTGLFNRRFFEEEMKRLDCARQLPISIIMGDINGLKLVNDIFGHLEGDKILKIAAEILKTSCRTEDIIARWGGDEFVILLPQTSNEEVSKLCKRIENSFKSIKNDNTIVSISLGYSTKTKMAEDILQSLKQAEDYMYQRKLLESKSLRSSVVASIKSTLHERSCETEEHAERIRTYCMEIGNAIGINDKMMDELMLFAVLHDIGKVAIKDTVLNKPAPLSAEEWAEMKRHSETGYHIAQATPELSHIAEYILCHHENIDGTGYPRGLSGDEIPLLSRILAIADAYDAMTSDRPYRRALTKEEALRELEKNAGTQFDKKIVRLFINKYSSVYR